MTGLPKSIIKKYGITKKAWQMYRGSKKKTKRKTTKTKTSRRKSKTAKKKTKRRRKPTMPFEVLMAGVGHLFMPASDYGTEAPFTAIQQGRFDRLGIAELAGWTGFDVGAPQNFDLFRSINPFDMGRAPYWKLLMWSGLISKVRRKIVPQSSTFFKKIPLLGKYIS